MNTHSVASQRSASRIDPSCEAGCTALTELLEAAVLQLLEAAAGCEAGEAKKLRSEVAGRSALLQLLGGSAMMADVW